MTDVCCVAYGKVVGEVLHLLCGFPCRHPSRYHPAVFLGTSQCLCATHSVVTALLRVRLVWRSALSVHAAGLAFLIALAYQSLRATNALSAKQQFLNKITRYNRAAIIRASDPSHLFLVRRSALSMSCML